MKTAILNGNIIDVRNSNLIQRMSLIIEDNRFVSITKNDNFPFLEYDQIIDAQNLYLIPGLIDMHCHASQNPREELGIERGKLDTSILGIIASQNLQSALDCGITSIRDLGSSANVMFEVKKGWDAKLFIGSRPFIAGPMITAIGGHGTEPGTKLGLEVCGTADIQHQVRTLIARGVDVIKLVTNGATVRTELTIDELKAAVDEAHWCGVKVACHAHFNERSVRNAVLAGCDTIEHGFMLDETMASLMAKNGIFLCPTIVVLKRVIETPSIYGGENSRFVRKIKQFWEIHKSNFSHAYQIGVKIIAGTDAGMPHIFFDSLFEELELMTEWGLPVNQALQSATINAADALGRTDIGEIKQGNIADLIIVEKNPLTDIKHLNTIRLVMQDGRIVRAQTPIKITKSI